MVLLRNAKKTIDRTDEQWEVSRRETTRKLTIRNKTFETFGTHNEERRPKRFNTHRDIMKTREMGFQCITYPKILHEG